MRRWSGCGCRGNDIDKCDRGIKDISRRQGRDDMNIKLLICDDDLIFAEALRQFLAEKLPDTVRFQVCGDRNGLMRKIITAICS